MRARRRASSATLAGTRSVVGRPPKSTGVLHAASPWRTAPRAAAYWPPSFQTTTTWPAALPAASGLAMFSGEVSSTTGALRSSVPPLTDARTAITSRRTCSGGAPASTISKRPAPAGTTVKDSTMPSQAACGALHAPPVAPEGTNTAARAWVDSFASM
jgi:hypothetical protein